MCHHHVHLGFVVTAAKVAADQAPVQLKYTTQNPGTSNCIINKNIILWVRVILPPAPSLEHMSPCV